jgi:hypothetical protein
MHAAGVIYITMTRSLDVLVHYVPSGVKMRPLCFHRASGFRKPPRSGWVPHVRVVDGPNHFRKISWFLNFIGFLSPGRTKLPYEQNVHFLLYFKRPSYRSTVTYYAKIHISPRTKPSSYLQSRMKKSNVFLLKKVSVHLVMTLIRTVYHPMPGLRVSEFED